MLSKTKENVQKYYKDYLESEDQYKKLLADIKTNYINGSYKYNQLVKEADSEYASMIRLMKMEGLQVAKDEFAKVRTKLNEIVMQSVSQEALTMAEMIAKGTLSEKEIDMYLDKHSSVYMDSKVLYGALGKPFTTVDALMEDVDRLEEYITDYYEKFSNDKYMHRNIAHGEMIDGFNVVINEFVNTYSNK